MPFGIASNLFLLAATLQHLFNNTASRFLSTSVHLLSGFYVDGLVVSSESLLEVEAIYSDTRVILQDPGMGIQKWASNSKVVQQQFLRDDTAYDNVSCTEPVLHVLGVKWDRLLDSTSMPSQAVSDFAKENCPIKRMVLHAVKNL